MKRVAPRGILADLQVFPLKVGLGEADQEEEEPPRGGHVRPAEACVCRVTGGCQGGEDEGALGLPGRQMAWGSAAREAGFPSRWHRAAEGLRGAGEGRGSWRHGPWRDAGTSVNLTETTGSTWAGEWTKERLKG